MRYSDTEVMFLSAVHKNVRALRPYLCSEVEVSVAKLGVLLRVLAPLFKKVYIVQVPASKANGACLPNLSIS